jgi:phage baseplate assembly protein W
MQKAVTKRYSDLDLDFGIHPVKKDIDTVTDEVAINRALKNLLLTRFFEKPFRPNFGSQVFEMLFEPVDLIVASNIESAIRVAIQNFEPRVTVIRVEATPDNDNNGYEISLMYSINNSILEDQLSEFKFFLERLR